jgi:hypothetical protein
MRTTTALPFAILCLIAGGCSWQPSRYPVSGTVTINGAPAALTHVIFVAVNPATPTSSGGSATTDKEGNFTITNGGKDPGLMAGEYKVIFQQTLIKGKPSLGGSRGKKSAMVPGETEGVPQNYQVPDTTPIHITVSSSMPACKFEITK